MCNKNNETNTNKYRLSTFENIKIMISDIKDNPWYKFAEIEIDKKSNTDTSAPYALAEFEIQSCNNINAHFKFIFTIEYIDNNKVKVYINESKKNLIPKKDLEQDILNLSPFNKNDLKVIDNNGKLELYFRIKSTNEDFAYRLNSLLSNKISVNIVNSHSLINEKDLEALKDIGESILDKADFIKTKASFSEDDANSSKDDTTSSNIKTLSLEATSKNNLFINSNKNTKIEILNSGLYYIETAIEAPVDFNETLLLKLKVLDSNNPKECVLNSCGTVDLVEYKMVTKNDKQEQITIPIGGRVLSFV